MPDPVKETAKKTIQEVTGTPAMQLRGLTPPEALQAFVARSATSTGTTSTAAAPPPEVKSNAITFQPVPPKTNEQPLPTEMGGGGGGGENSTLTARHVGVSSGTPTTATGDFLIP